MVITNDAGGGGWSGPFADMLRLQNEFQARLGEETIRYLRRLQGALGPAAPGTVVLREKSSELSTQGAPGAAAELRVELENLQRVHCVLTPHLTPLVSETGTTWFPVSDVGGAFRILAPGTTDSLTIRLEIPPALPAGVYRGALMLLGFREGALSVTVHIITAQPAEARTAAGTPKPPGRNANTRRGRKP
jgi:hypothetical protein